MKGDWKRAEEIAALGRLLETCGADRTRWPAPERLRFAPLLKSEKSARDMVAEAAALDRLLDTAPQVSGARAAALAERIVAAAHRNPQSAAPAGHAAAAAMQPVDVSARGITDLAARRAVGLLRPVVRLPFGRASWPAAGMLAASLVLGIFAGDSGVLGSAIQILPGIAQSEGDSDSLHLALGGENGTAVATDEDTL